MNPYDIKNIHNLIKKTRPIIVDKTDAPSMDYDTKEKGLSIVLDGYTTLPGVYAEPFLDPLKQLIEKYDYSEILSALDRNGKGPWRDWLESIDQRKQEYLKDATYAFEECIADIYDGYLSMSQRHQIKPPDHQTVSPLVSWGASGHDLFRYLRS